MEDKGEYKFEPLKRGHQLPEDWVEPGKIFYRDESGNFRPLAKGEDGKVLYGDLTRYSIFQELQQARDVLDAFMDDDANIEAIKKAADLMIESLKAGGKIIACGNGGSMCDAMHFCAELTGKYREERTPLPAIAISDPAHLSCVGNDFGYSDVFERHLRALGKSGDVCLLLSTSGRSANVLGASTMAGSIGMKNVVITGGKNTWLEGHARQNTEAVIISIPHARTADRIQEMTIKILHILVMLIERGIGYE